MSEPATGQETTVAEHEPQKVSFAEEPTVVSITTTNNAAVEPPLVYINKGKLIKN